MAMKMGAAICETIRFEPISEDEVTTMMKQSGDPQPVIDAHLSIYRAIREQRLATVTDRVERVLGRPAIRFDEWVFENVSRFTMSVGRDDRTARSPNRYDTVPYRRQYPAR